MISVDNIASHEFVGLHTEIVSSTNPQIVGLNGRVSEETKSMLRINTENGTKFIAKSNSNWQFTIQNKQVTIEGSKITKRPFDRIGAKL